MGDEDSIFRDAGDIDSGQSWSGSFSGGENSDSDALASGSDQSVLGDSSNLSWDSASEIRDTSGWGGVRGPSNTFASNLGRFESSPGGVGSSGTDAGRADVGQPAGAAAADPLGPSSNRFVNLFESKPQGDAQSSSLLGMRTQPMTSPQSSGEPFIHSFESSMNPPERDEGTGAPDSLTTEVKGEEPGEDKQKDIEEQRKQWEFDKGIDSSKRRGRVWPSDGRINSEYQEERQHPIHEGIVKPHRALDIKNPKGGTVVSAGDGTVQRVGNSGDLGNHVIIDYDNGYRGVYGHTAPTVQPGQQVRAGDPVGNTDLSGATTGPHVHYEVHNPKTGQKLNPRDYLPHRLQ